MPDRLHQSIVESIEGEPSLAIEIVSATGWKPPAYASLEVANVALSEAKPITGAVDVVIRLKDAAGKAVYAIIVEVQMQSDPDKEWTWPKYWALVREREHVPTMLLVIAGDDTTARWARTLIKAGDPHEWRPVVTTLVTLPRITDPEVVAGDPVRAVICALGHSAELEVVSALVDGLQRAPLSERLFVYYLDLVLGEAPSSLREVIMEDLKHEFRTEFARKYFSQGLEKGREEGLEKGRQEARQSVRALLARRSIALTPEQERRIDTCTDLEMLHRWLNRAVDAASAADVIADD